MALFAITAFISAFLLFQVQPLIGKFILPWFGSTPAVWTTVMLFFQVMLLGGYCYADVLARMRSTRNQVVVHMSLLVAAMLLLPIIPSDDWRATGLANPTWRILLLLLVTVGGPYFLISSSAPLLQSWFARMRPGVEPYRLYAFSNAGSMLALLSYPFVFERFLPLRTQAWTWSGGYVLLAALIGAWPSFHAVSTARQTSIGSRRPALM